MRVPLFTALGLVTAQLRMPAKSELIFGLVAPVGVDLDTAENTLSRQLEQFAYKSKVIRLSSLVEKIDGLKTQVVDRPQFKRIDSHMTAGNEARETSKRGDILALHAAYEIYKTRKRRKEKDRPLEKTAHILRSLKHPQEVELLRNVYGNAFFLLGLASSRSNRVRHLTKQLGMTEKRAKRLIDRDESEENEFGQHTRDVFHLADGFVDADSDYAEDQIGRVLDMIFEHPYKTPTKDEYAMFLAFAASFRSGDLSRQVGAVVVTNNGEIVSTGANDVPCFGGGLYWSDSVPDEREHTWKCDSNEEARDEIVLQIMKTMRDGERNDAKLLNEGKKILKHTGLFDLTEYGRAVHAEMEALLSCARSGVSTKDGTLYCTTFPCHNCAKHIIASGIRRVVFVEPYPKSQAVRLHKDAISLKNESEGNDTDAKVQFEPFVGVGPRRFLDLFSLHLSSGCRIVRKKDGKTVEWTRKGASVRVPELAVSYVEREQLAITQLDKAVEREDANN